MKRCTGPLCRGRYVPLENFYFHKQGTRKGKPFSRCKLCLAHYKFGDGMAHGWIRFDRVKFIFDELVNRLGKTETLRRVGLSQNFLLRRRKENQKFIRKQTVVKAMMVLQEVRANNEVRHRKSIRYGAAQRGRAERVPVKKADYYSRQDDSENEVRREASLTR
jgi:hypothetical protein